MNSSGYGYEDGSASAGGYRTGQPAGYSDVDRNTD
jgi:hypothetical protein